jgi:Glutaredoxin-like domain (DUF836)
VLNNLKRYYDLFLCLICYLDNKLTLKMHSMVKQLILYSTSHCHLCDLALKLVMQTSEQIEIHIIDIAEDDSLFQQYGLRIPVLQRKDTQIELNWPFCPIDVDIFLK